MGAGAGLDPGRRGCGALGPGIRIQVGGGAGLDPGIWIQVSGGAGLGPGRNRCGP